MEAEAEEEKETEKKTRKREIELADRHPTVSFLAQTRWREIERFPGPIQSIRKTQSISWDNPLTAPQPPTNSSGCLAGIPD